VKYIYLMESLVKSLHLQFGPSLLLSVVTLTACGSTQEANESPTSTPIGAEAGAGAETDGGADVAEGPQYWRDVAPIFAKRCDGCHQSEGQGPFALDNYRDASMWAPLAASAVKSRTMPPWLMTDDGSCGSFADSSWLSETEIDTIDTWAKNGAPEGPELTPAPVPVPAHLAADVTYSTPEYRPIAQGGALAEFDDYRCFLIRPDLTKDQFLTGYEVVPGNSHLVHHVLMMPVDPDAVVTEDGLTNGDLIQTYDAESPDRDGWPCFGAAGEGIDIAGFPVTWAPGMGPVSYPRDSGVHLPQNTWLVVQVHYNLHDQDHVGESDSTQVRVALSDSVTHAGEFQLPDLFLDTLFSGEPALLEPGIADAVFTWELPIESDVDVYGVFPHMHQMGKAMEMELLRPGSQTTCLGDVRSWDFNWELFYFYEAPIRVDRGDTLRVTCHFDTTARVEPVTPGWGTENEMCLAGLFIVPR
jgi:Copper type II ascorbate-dependent monooxygenase, C-terminal domain/Copper type II ascorbate-dependent monooxygenase, N-terminal domain